ncbi:MAG TPA: hypothetical protein VEV86_00615, partial [Vicinamibacterales bacterium]|nr:hypothetical protein [Vicinamibacterales bacterium]
RALAKLPGIDYTPIARPEDNEAGFQWSEMWRDIKKHEGFGTSIVEPQFGPEGRDWNIWARRGLGFAGDIGADPFSYLSIGTHAAPGTEARISAMNKLLDAQNAAKIEGRAATEAAETADDWARLIGGTGADEAQQATAAAAQQAQQRLEDLTTIRGQDAQSLIGRRGVNVATPEQLRVMGQQQHAIRFGGVPIPGAASEAASRAMSRMLSPGKELFTRTAGAQGRKLFNPTGVLGQKLAPATERILTGEGPLSMEKALRTHAVDQAMRLARGEFRAPARQFLHQLDESLQGISREDRAALVKAAEEQGVENSTTKMAENMIATMRAMGLDPPELKPWALPNGAQSKYVMPHVLSRDAFRFFNKLRKGDNPLIDFIRRDLGVTDKDLLEEGGFLQRRLFRPNADGSPQVFKIGKDEVTITTGSVAELEEKLGGLLRQHGFEGNLYESNPVEAWRRYIKSTEKDVARNVALKHGAENFGMEGLRNKPEAPRSYDPYGRDLKMQPAEGETDPRYIRGEATSRRPADTDVYEMVADDKATEARNKIITEGGDKNVHQQVLGEYREAAPAVRENLAHQIEATREYTEAAFDKARAQSAKKLTRAEKIVSDTRATVDKLETEYVELLKEASANDRLIEAGQSAIHGVRSQTPKNIKRAIQERLDEIARQLEHERGRLESLQGGLKHALEASEQKQIDDRLEAFASRHEAVLRAEKDLESTRKKATAAVAKRIDRETKGRDHLISEIEHRQAQEFVGRGDNARSRRAAELLERRDSLTAQEAIRRNQALDLQRQAERIEEALSRRTGGSTPRTEARQARIEAGQVNQAAEARRLRRQARVETNRANKLADDLRDAERRIKDDDWLKAQRVVEQYAEQQEMINGYSNAATRVDMRAAQGRLHAAQADMRSYELDESLAAKAAAEANKTPLQRSEDRLTEAIGAKPDVSYAISPPDDLPGGEEGLHRIILTTEAAPPKGEAAASTLPEWMQGSTPNARTGTDPADPQYVSSLIWSAKSGEVMMISVDEAFRRKGIGTRMYDYAT